MISRNFNDWLSSFRDSIATYDYYTDFEKVYENMDNIKTELCILNSLIGSSTVKEDFKDLVKEYPKVIHCIPLLLAVRENEVYCNDVTGGRLYRFTQDALALDKTARYEQYAYFMERTGLFKLLEKRIINNLVDYVTGVEVGLDSNARKNRGGKLMENLVESFIKRAGFIEDETYFRQVKTEEFVEKWSLDLSFWSAQGNAVKQFDFAVKADTTFYGIETNFYRTGGSKLNETARSYKALAQEAQEIDNFAFVWITDGKGWKSARNNLEEAFNSMKHIYNIADLETKILKEVLK